ncbi:MAG: XdhC family protein, partial [Deltaproteobacteria bacterium]|nr:XdhC family protein [Deltaproteobacteria bacterium]
EKFPVDEDSYLVIVTRGHVQDKNVLAQALRTDAKYIGMIGSKRKRDIIYEKLLEQGFSQDDLARVHSPIGLEIGAETPEEIAVSIVAELIKVRAEE